MKQARTWMGILGLATVKAASAGMVGPATDYNAFIFGNGSFTALNSETIGNVAVGGNVSLTSYSIAQGIQGNGSVSMTTPDPARIVAGGALTTHNGGSVGIGGSGTIYYGNTAPSLNNNGTFTAAATVGNQTLVDFSTAGAFYTNYSQQLGAISATNISPGNSLTLTGLHSGLNVFDINDASALTLSSINISGASDATVLINVLGASPVKFNFLGETLSGVSGANLLFNFVAATSVDVEGTLTSSILAPHAGVIGANGDIVGQLIAGSYNGSNEFKNTAFAGSLPAPVPLPDSAALMVSGLLLGAGFALRGRGSQSAGYRWM